MHDRIDVSVWQRVQLGHAALQVVVDGADVDVLHIKGPALDRSLTPGPRYSTDADLLVRHSKVPLLQLYQALERPRSPSEAAYAGSAVLSATTGAAHATPLATVRRDVA